jgi:peptidoglycan/xylan/chitin deacetylase (PgdA/CDA1 family)
MARVVSMRQQLLLVNYHYVRDPHAYSYPGIHPISPDAFAQQIKLLASKLHIATPDEAEAFLLHGTALPRDSVLLTFDDGLVDHWETARDILDPMGLKALFFVCTRPLTEHRAVPVHKIHWLRATTEPDRFRADLLDELPGEWRSRKLTDDETKAARATYVYDRPQDAEIKYLMNFLLPEEVIDVATSGMLERAGVSEADFCARTYMDGAALRALEKSGHRVEAHTHDHRPVTRLGAEEDKLMSGHVRALADVLGRKPTWISFPFGRDWALPQDAAAFCKRYGFAIGVTLKGTWVKPEHAPYALDRINTNEVEQVVSERNVAVS